MTTRNKTAEVMQLRDAALKLLAAHGTLLEAKGIGGRFLSANAGDLSLMHRTPFQRLPATSSSVAYAGALMKQRGQKVRGSLPYGLDIWHKHRKVLNCQWSAGDGEFEIVSFKPGAWTIDLLATQLIQEA